MPVIRWKTNNWSGFIGKIKIGFRIQRERERESELSCCCFVLVKPKEQTISLTPILDSNFELYSWLHETKGKFEAATRNYSKESEMEMEIRREIMIGQMRLDVQMQLASNEQEWESIKKEKEMSRKSIVILEARSRRGRSIREIRKVAESYCWRLLEKKQLQTSFSWGSTRTKLPLCKLKSQLAPNDHLCLSYSTIRTWNNAATADSDSDPDPAIDPAGSTFGIVTNNSNSNRWVTLPGLGLRRGSNRVAAPSNAIWRPFSAFWDQIIRFKETTFGAGKTGRGEQAATTAWRAIYSEETLSSPSYSSSSFSRTSSLVWPTMCVKWYLTWSHFDLKK